MVFKKLSKKDAYQAIFLVVLSIITLVLGILISSRVLELVAPLSDYFLPFGISFIVISSFCLTYAVLIIIMVILKYRK